MSELENLLNDIEKLRKNLHNLLDERNIDLADPEVISASEMLNAAIVKYAEIISKKSK